MGTGSSLERRRTPSYHVVQHPLCESKVTLCSDLNENIPCTALHILILWPQFVELFRKD